MRRLILTAIIAVFAAAPASAQQATPRVDRVGHIVAIVGDSAILNFDIQDGVLALAAQTGRQITPGTPEYEQAAQQVLDVRITELLILQAAARDTSIQVLDDQVERLVQQKVDEDAATVGGMAALEQALGEAGLTMAAYRERLVRQFTRQSMIEQYRSRATQARRPPPITDRDLRELFEARREEIGRRPATVTIQRVVVPTSASEAAYAEARERADSVFALVRAGEDFADLARQFGEDATRDSGGDLGWMRRSEMIDRAFADAAFSMQAGGISAPVRTSLGYHLINVQRVRGAEIQLRHIFFRPEVTPADLARAEARADTVAERLRSGADAAALARQYGAPEQLVRQGPMELSGFEQRYGTPVGTSQVGNVIGPLAVGPTGAVSELVVIRIVEREAEREWSIEDPTLRDQLRSQAEYGQLMDRIVADLRRSTYVEIRGF